MMRIWVSALVCVAFVIKHILCQARHKLYRDLGSGCESKGFCILLEEVQLWAAAQYEQKKDRKLLVLYKGCQRMKPKITSCYMRCSIPVNLFMTVPFLCIWALIRAFLYEVFQQGCADSTC
jgi:hypothetical protein